MFVRVAVAVGAGDPDLLAADALAHRLEHVQLIADAVDARRPVVSCSMTSSREPGRTTPRMGTTSSAANVRALLPAYRFSSSSAWITGWWAALLERNSSVSSSGGSRRR